MDITRRDFSFEQLETQLRDQLQRMLGPGGFNRETDILAITVTAGHTATRTSPKACTTMPTKTKN